MWLQKSMQARKKGKGECGVAAVLDLNGGSGCSEHALLAVPWWNWSEGEVEGVAWSFQRGSGVVL